jgi:hypothetical protein
MTLSVKALATVGAVLVGGTLLLVAVANLTFPGYGDALLQVAASLYPGYHGPAGFGSVLIVALYGAVDGVVGGAVIALIYNAMMRRALPKGERFAA